MKEKGEKGTARAKFPIGVGDIVRVPEELNPFWSGIGLVVATNFDASKLILVMLTGKMVDKRYGVEADKVIIEG